MNTEILKEIIISNESFILNEVKKIVPREGLFFPSSAEIKKVCLIYGVRRSGKSYILFELFKKHKDKALYVDFEDERLADFKAGDFEKLKESFFELKPHLLGSKAIVYLFDEVQNVEGWEKFTRRMVEKEGIAVFATGSSSMIMPQELQTSLRGRSWGIQALPFSFIEYLKAKDMDITIPEFIHGAKKILVKNYFSEYFRWGGFPELAFLSSEYEKRKVLKEYLEAMFFKDLVERFKIKNIFLLDALRDKLFSSFSLKYSLTAFCRQYKDKFPFSKDSVFAYMRYFLESMLLFEVRKLSESSYQRLRNPSKIYLVDVGLAKKVTSEDTGRILENIVFLGLKRKGNEIFYFENNNECDFVAKSEEDKYSAYQVVWQLNDKTKDREIKGLVEACKYLKLAKGTILTYDDEGEEKTGKIYIKIMPVRKWLLGWL